VESRQSYPTCGEWSRLRLSAYGKIDYALRSDGRNRKKPWGL